ncbi:restriction endonuclease subunit S, partial [uncultured Treponema sp.]|uniref:restriction endonuclease subunit S n=1 Tax=uncultured Treponema sp. TaxID=162155 RepID=UPI0025EE6CC0
MTAKDLKNALLQEAVQGKLVPQIASEGNARDLLEEIRKEKLSHGLDFANAKSGKRKSKKETALAGSNPCDITEEEIPFDIPESWCWCRLGEVVEIKTNLVDSAKYPDYIQIAPDDIGKGTGTLIKEKRTVKQKSIKSINHLFHEDMLLYSKIRPRLQKVVYVDFEGLCSADMYPLDTKINKHYLKYVLLSDFFDQEIKVFENRVKMPKLNIEQLNSTIIPLPPLSEQKRIVAAIEKFMPLIEEYGKKETQLKAINEKIGTLTKKAILQEAVQGKLVPQIASEGNARDLLEEIRKERLSHGFANSYGICDGKNKKSKSSDLRSKSQIRVTKKELPEITEDEIPFDIPENWCWCRLGDISTFNGGYAFKSGNYVTKENGVRVLRISDFDETGIKEKDPVYYPFNTEMENYKLSVNDIIMCMTGGTVGKSYLVKILNEEMYVNQR